MNYKVFFIALTAVAMSSSSCTKWLDVQPKTNISERVLFEDEQGFKDALIGVYVKMASAELYAKEFTMATMDVFAQQYDVSGNTNQYYEFGRYNYSNAAVQSRVNQFWNSSYNAIANLNNLLTNLEGKENLFSEGNYELIKGEALALRAYLHFDLFRAFGPIPAVGMQNESIPYVDVFEMKVKPNLTGQEFINKCMQDLNDAISLLSAHKSVNYGLADPFKSHTRNHLNYWAANGLKARISLYVGDKSTALQSARVVIDNAALFPFIQRNNLAGTAPNRTFLSEQLFGIYIPTLKDINDGLFRSSSGSSVLTNKESFFTEVYESSSTDFRKIFLFNTDGTTSQLYPVKYYTDDIQTDLLNTKRVPLLRLSEVCYIAAEASVDPIEKIKYLNLVRTNRGLGSLSNDLIESQIELEIFKEYRKEFYQEGQLFFYYKRNNTQRISGYGQDMTDQQYVLPRPNDEIEFNN
ncbi:RagB/SusD family nutrient uptake outer membrane protein [Sphingobacterium rhinopitheci]|uniref:RagB/SusD family nutrient uptake outer membrane protein n=1 Tax=Sphingobacterium rhinopitheci TaxID=2781960 RepID=UPI001F51CC34|nr:RagB/SusD family nutrient uptake outer membrane protein [Sphingobacterium rhinopitheci]MCI0921205.1 RagB/SusD family nutrient uptake outer membrane protein [Sphingobacterium rhinopitheci]